MSIKSHVHFLKLSTLFKDFSHEELITFFTENNYTISLYNRNSIIHFESEKCSTLDIILKGKVVVQKIDEKGNILTITQFGAGSNMSGNLLFSNSPYYPMSIIAKSDTVILHINKDLVLQLCQNNKSFLQEFLTCMSDKTMILTNKIKSISMKSIRDSIIDFLSNEYYSQNNGKIKLGMTKKELAERLGIQRTSLSRELSKMKKDGIVLYDSDSITIKDYRILNKNI